MSINELRPQPSVGETIRLMELIEIDIVGGLEGSKTAVVILV